MKRAFSKIKIRQLAGDILTIVFVGFLMVASLLVYEHWLGGEANSNSGDIENKIIESSNLKY
jgi:hypothetical protein